MSTSEQTRDVIDRFNEAFNAKDVDAVMALMTEDVLHESPFPPPDGQAVRGHAANREHWAKFFADNPNAWFDTEDMIVADDRCATLWVYTFDRTDPDSGHVRGADLFKVRDGKVSEKLSYVKG